MIVGDLVTTVNNTFGITYKIKSIDNDLCTVITCDEDAIVFECELIILQKKRQKAHLF